MSSTAIMHNPGVDVVRRLRDAAEVYENDHYSLDLEAADEIERLRRVVADATMSAPHAPAGGGRMVVRNPMRDTITFDLNPCTFGWAGCDGNYTGGHYCERDADHAGRHRCECGASSNGSEGADR